MSKSRAYFPSELALVKCVHDAEKGMTLPVHSPSPIYILVPVALKKGDELLVSTPDGKVWAARRNRDVFWIEEGEEFFVAATVPKNPQFFSIFWGGLDLAE